MRVYSNGFLLFSFTLFYGEVGGYFEEACYTLGGGSVYPQGSGVKPSDHKLQYTKAVSKYLTFFGSTFLKYANFFNRVNCVILILFCFIFIVF